LITAIIETKCVNILKLRTNVYSAIMAGFTSEETLIIRFTRRNLVILFQFLTEINISGHKRSSL